MAIALIAVAGGAIYTSYPVQADDLDKLLQAEIPTTTVKARVRIAFNTAIDSTACYIGDAIEADLKEDIKYHEEVLVPRGSKLYGHINSNDERKQARTVRSKDLRYRKNGPISMYFDELVTPQHQHFAITGKPAPQVSVFNSNKKTRLLQVAANGTVTKAETMDLLQLPDLDLAISSSLVDPKRSQIRIQPGDELKVDANVPITSSSVSARVLKK